MLTPYLDLQAAQGSKVTEKKDQLTAAAAHAAHKANPVRIFFETVMLFDDSG